ncbi:MAG: methylated-DNA--[protein]-cysteine S-methyltransferase [Bacteroidaceae bacterium]|nr:methylated-DNA--[protein]-cysteine S-methyltransferase [Bacteroidaceae bacterium]
MNYIWQYNSPLGGMTMTSDGSALTGLWYNNQPSFRAALGQQPIKIELPVFVKTQQWLDIYFSGMQPDFLPLLKMQGTPFQQKVWKVLLTIPYGQTTTYGAIARIINNKSAQAVGGAIRRNPIGIIVPCHRVIGTNGSLTGYAGGLDKKVWLLKLEGIRPKV